jgi:hypothetical protein
MSHASLFRMLPLASTHLVFHHLTSHSDAKSAHNQVHYSRTSASCMLQLCACLKAKQAGADLNLIIGQYRHAHLRVCRVTIGVVGMSERGWWEESNEMHVSGLCL